MPAVLVNTGTVLAGSLIGILLGSRLKESLREAVMRALGLRTAPTDFEAEFVQRWQQEYGFSMDVILNACRKAVAGTQSHRLEYTDGILRNWREKDIRTIGDIASEDAAHEEKRTKRKSAKTAEPEPVDTRNRFNRFKAQEYDFEAIKSKLVSNK